MSDRPIIEVENLGKRYRLGAGRGAGQNGAQYRTLRESLSEGARRLWPRGTTRGSRDQSKADLASADPTEFWALKDVSFEVKPGEVVGIIGRNGAGKSTLLKILSRITEPTQGRVTLRGRVASLLEVGTGFHPELTGRENIFLNGAVLGMQRAEIKSKFDEIVAFAEVDRFLDTPVKRYSSGMYVRLAFAVAAHLEPEILIVDEVLAVGDAEFQKKCLGKMESVAKGEGRTVLFVSHNMQAVTHLCTNAMLLRNGRLDATGKDVISLTNTYLTGGEHARPATWVNLQGGWQNNQFTPSRLYIGDEDGALLPMPLRRDQPCWVHVRGDIANFDPALQVGYELFSQDGILLFMCFDTDQEDTSWTIRGPGKVAIRSLLPVELLNEGRYRLELSAGLRWRQWFCIPGKDAPTIEIEVTPGQPMSSYWTEKRLGLLAPLVRWQSAANDPSPV